MTFKNGDSYFQISGDPGDNYLDAKRKEVNQLHGREKLVAQTVLLLGQTLCICLDNHDFEMFEILRQEINSLFGQADEIINGINKVQ